jgi:ATP-dependent RNA helicase SUPV3L1/SUV3
MSATNCAVPTSGYLSALLGPTNTGKTYQAVERMLAHHSGIMGFPLRLLARENYDRVVALKGKEAVALVTGEEKIIPASARYYMCTVEAMPQDRSFDFLAVDEIQLCADPDRGHVFTDRLLRARGVSETMFMGADTVAPLLRSLVPGIDIRTQARFSQLTYTGHKKLTRLPPRSAIVAFTINDLYEIADLIRRQRGGTAVVLGALSPRTRNAQVEMYQSGEVDFMVATDAIGMGLNMDIHHVAFASTRKFDGDKLRTLSNGELGQIAGRAGRHRRDGTFGVTGPVHELEEETVEAIETHEFETLGALTWRNSNLDFSSPRDLLKSLEKGSGNPQLIKGWPGDDLQALAKLMQRDEIMGPTDSEERVRLLWDVCQIPDFRKILSESHQDLLAQVYLHLTSPAGVLPEDWVTAQMLRLDKTDGDVDTLMSRITHVRTWTYMAYRPGWFKNPAQWQEKARAIEDRLSDALHEALLRRFVDRRSTTLIRGKGADNRALLAGIKADGVVVVEGHPVGHLQGFRFIPDTSVTGQDRKLIMTVARNTLKPEIERRLQMILNAQPKQFSLKDDGQIYFQQDASNPLPGEPLAKIIKGTSLLQPGVELINSDLLSQQDEGAVTEHVQTWLKAHIFALLEPLFALVTDETLPATARGIAYQVFEGTGIIPRSQIEDLIATLDSEGRQALRNKKVKLGPILVFQPDLNKPAAVRLRALLWSLFNGQPLPAPVPRDGAMSVVVDPVAINPDFYRAIGYPVYGTRAVRIDMLDRVINAVYDSAKDGKFQAQHKQAEWMGCPIADLYGVLEAMGHKRIQKKEETAVPAIPADAVAAAVIAEPTEVSPDAAATEEVKAPAAKPELDWFFLRRGKAHQEQAARAPRPHSEKKFEKRADGQAGEKRDFKKKDSDRKESDGKRGKFDRNRDNKRGAAKEKPQPRVYTAEAKSEDNPFAVLKSLKLK